MVIGNWQLTFLIVVSGKAIFFLILVTGSKKRGAFGGRRVYWIFGYQIIVLSSWKKLRDGKEENQDNNLLLI